MAHEDNTTLPGSPERDHVSVPDPTSPVGTPAHAAVTTIGDAPTDPLPITDEHPSSDEPTETTHVQRAQTPEPTDSVKVEVVQSNEQHDQQQQVFEVPGERTGQTSDAEPTEGENQFLEARQTVQDEEESGRHSIVNDWRSAWGRAVTKEAKARKRLQPVHPRNYLPKHVVCPLPLATVAAFTRKAPPAWKPGGGAAVAAPALPSYRPSQPNAVLPRLYEPRPAPKPAPPDKKRRVPAISDPPTEQEKRITQRMFTEATQAASARQRENTQRHAFKRSARVVRCNEDDLDDIIDRLHKDGSRAYMQAREEKVTYRTPSQLSPTAVQGVITRLGLQNPAAPCSRKQCLTSQ